MAASNDEPAASVWTEMTLRVLPAGVDDACDLLRELTGNDVSIEPAIEALGPDEGYTLDTSAPLVLHAYVYGPVDDERRRGLAASIEAAPVQSSVVGDVAWAELREEDWAEAWKSHYDIEHAGRVVIRPAWREYEAAPGEVVVSLDPGMAFGTGQHPTTRMCLDLLQTLLRPGDRVLDLGTGSGILAIAAIRLGAASCLALDIEEQAVKAATANVALNALDGRIEVRGGSVDAAPAGEPFDLVLANINAATVARLAPEIYKRLKPGREVFAGGVIAERESLCLDALRVAGFEVVQRVEDGDWRTFVARKVTSKE